MSPWDLTPKNSGTYRRNEPRNASGKLAILALCVIFTIMALAFWLTPPLWK